MKWLILVLGVLFNASASVLVKVAVMPPRQFPSLANPWVAFTNWPLIVGLACFGMAFLFYAAALERLPLNVAHPILTSGAVALVALVSGFYFRDPFHWNTIVGIILVVSGVLLITTRVG